MLISITIWLNQIATAIANLLLAPLAWIPDGLSLTLIAAITGLIMLMVIKYTSHQPALQYTRNQIKANLLALSLFKDHLGVGFRVQGALLWGAVRLLGLSVVPMLVMTHVSVAQPTLIMVSIASFGCRSTGDCDGPIRGRTGTFRCGHSVRCHGDFCSEGDIGTGTSHLEKQDLLDNSDPTTRIARAHIPTRRDALHQGNLDRRIGDAGQHQASSTAIDCGAGSSA